MKNLKEFKPLLKLIGEEKKKLVIASIIIFISNLTNILTGYLNGGAVEAITNLQVEKALIFLGIYFICEILFDFFILRIQCFINWKVY